MNQKRLKERQIPEHVAVIMDGNGRWAQRNGKSRIEGHRNGVNNVRQIVETAREMCVQHLTLYAFSVENWKRPKAEVSALMALLNTFLKRELSNMMKNGIRLNVIGRIDDLPTNVRKNLRDTMEKTANNSNLVLSLALNYGARTEILDAVQSYISKNDVQKCGELEWSTFSKHLYTREMPDPDLIIRTSGEHRLSNFLLLQGAYAEIYFTDLCWPEFHKEDFLKAIMDYQGRERRYGLTGEQVRTQEEPIQQG